MHIRDRVTEPGSKPWFLKGDPVAVYCSQSNGNICLALVRK